MTNIANRPDEPFASTAMWGGISLAVLAAAALVALNGHKAHAAHEPSAAQASSTPVSIYGEPASGAESGQVVDYTFGGG